MYNLFCSVHAADLICFDSWCILLMLFYFLVQYGIRLRDGSGRQSTTTASVTVSVIRNTRPVFTNTQNYAVPNLQETTAAGTTVFTPTVSNLDSRVSSCHCGDCVQMLTAGSVHVTGYCVQMLTAGSVHVTVVIVSRC